MNTTAAIALTGAVIGAVASAQTPVKTEIALDLRGPSLLRADAWEPYEEGFARKGDVIVCDNGADGALRRGARQVVVLNQETAAPIRAEVWSRAEGVTGSRDSGYSLYLDILHTDGTPTWGQISSFPVGTHDWQRREVVVVPRKPIRHVSVYLLLRGHGGRARFRDAALYQPSVPAGVARFDGVPVEPPAEGQPGFQIRDVKARSGFWSAKDAEQLGLEATVHTDPETGMHSIALRDTTGTDRALTVVYAVPVPRVGLAWLHGRSGRDPVGDRGDYALLNRSAAGRGQMSRWPLAAVAGADGSGRAVSLDLASPAIHRCGYSAGTRELYVACDIALAPEAPAATLRMASFTFPGGEGFRGAVARLYEVFPEAFRCRVPTQGLWMPFAKVSEVEDWEDFGFRIKEGTNETAWDDANGLLTFRYTEPMSWWMAMDAALPRTVEAAVAEAKRLATAGNARARSLLTSGFHDETGTYVARLRDTPWCDGAVWSMNSMPGIRGDVTDFSVKWNAAIRERLYGENAAGDPDGEYVDSSEGYMTDELDFRRDHFAAVTTPLTFAADTLTPALHRYLIAFEYIRELRRETAAMGKLMMANATPNQTWFFAPQLDVMGTETNWSPGGEWAPMSHDELFYRRALCGPKPYCFLMNTDFDQLSHDRVEAYMRRCLAYGMFPGFFSHNASEGHYFTRPELYNRDRLLFTTYVPLCRRVAEAGWQPVTMARADHPEVTVERFGTRYVTVYNDGVAAVTCTVFVEDLPVTAVRDLVSGQPLATGADEAGVVGVAVPLEGGAVAVLDLADPGD